MSMTSVNMLKHVLEGLPPSCVVKLSVAGKLYDLEVAGITRMNGVPDPKNHKKLREFVVLADNGNFMSVELLTDMKRVFTARDGREGEPS